MSVFDVVFVNKGHIPINKSLNWHVYKNKQTLVLISIFSQ